MSPATVRAGRRRVEISSPDKALFPEAGLTKLDLAHYYARIAPVMLPHVRDRPVSLQSFPGGIHAPGHFTKDIPGHFPDWIERVRVPKRGGTVNHLLCQEAATLVYLAGQNCITPHVWTSRADQLRRPDRLVFDLDPSEDDFAEVRAAARATGDLLRDLGLTPHAMTSGSRGIHVVVPLRRELEIDRVRAFAAAVAEALAEQHPRQLTTEKLKRNREGRLYIDVNRNGYAQTTVPPYAARPRPRAPVAMPLRWEELGDRRLDPQGWTIVDAHDRVADGGDAWKGIGRRARSLRAALRRIERR